MNLVNLFRRDDELQTVQDGEYLLKAGGRSKTVYVLVEGSLEIRVDGRNVEIVEPGGVVGEMSMIEDEPVSADVLGKGEAKVAVVDANRFQFLIQNHPFFAIEVMKIMAHRLRATHSQNRG